LAEAVIDYNKMIAEYTSETIPPEVSGFRLVGALIELPKTNPPTSNSPTPNSSTLHLPTSNLPTPNPPISNQSTEYTESETIKLSGTPQMNPQTEIPYSRSSSNLVPQRLPTRNVLFPPIEPAIIQTSHVEEQ
jgi:hypothetical protein